jgi:hypothetical protein
MSIFDTCLAKTVCIDYFCLSKTGLKDCIGPVNMDMAMEIIARFEDIQEPTESDDALMWQIRAILDASSRRMGDKHIQKTPVSQPVGKQTWYQPKDMTPHLALGVLIWSWTVPQASLNSS